MAIMTTPQKQARIPTISILRNFSLLMRYPSRMVQKACVFCTIVIIDRGSSWMAKQFRVCPTSIMTDR